MSDRKVFNVHGLYPSDYCFDWEAFEADPEHYAFTADDIAYFNAMELERFEKETPMTPYEKRAGCKHLWIRVREKVTNIEERIAVTGIMDDMVAGSPMFEQALSDFLSFAGDMILVGHNIRRFDLKFLYRDAMTYWGKTIGNDYVDTLILSKVYLPELDLHNLPSLSEYYGISTEGAHRALNDCRMTQQLYERLKEETAHPSPSAMAVKKCPRCGNLLKKREGIYGEFLGCASFPDCRYTQKC